MKVLMLLAVMISTQTFANISENNDVLTAIDAALAEQDLSCRYKSVGNPEENPEFKATELNFSASAPISKVEIDESVPAIKITVPAQLPDEFDSVATVTLSEDAERVKTISILAGKKIIKRVNRGTITRPDIQEVVEYKTSYTIDCK